MNDLKNFRDRNISYVNIDKEVKPSSEFKLFERFIHRALSFELVKGMALVFKQMFDNHTVEYPQEKLNLSPRYRAVHNLTRFIESESEKCIGCGLCEKICISNCIQMDTQKDENGRKIPSKYSINLGRCIYCGLCAEVCPELAIVMGSRYELASEQRSSFALKDDMLWSKKDIKNPNLQEFEGYGALSTNSDKVIKRTPLLLASDKQEIEELNKKESE